MSKFPTIEVQGEQVVYHIMKVPSINPAPGFPSRGHYEAILMWEGERRNVYGKGKTAEDALNDAVRQAQGV